MLKIAVVANSYPEALRFVRYKFRDHVKEIKASEAIFTLHNGDKLYLCYDERRRDEYKSMVFDAFLVTEQYESLLDVIMHRTMRPS